MEHKIIFVAVDVHETIQPSITQVSDSRSTDFGNKTSPKLEAPAKTDNCIKLTSDNLSTPADHDIVDNR